MRGRIIRLSVLFNEPKLLKSLTTARTATVPRLSVLFNEPKLLKYTPARRAVHRPRAFSALQRAEIAEILSITKAPAGSTRFQCSSTSRNC